MNVSESEKEEKLMRKVTFCYSRRRCRRQLCIERFFRNFLWANKILSILNCLMRQETLISTFYD